MMAELETLPVGRSNGTVLGRLITQLREARDMSKQALADAAGISRGYVSQLEAGEDKQVSREVIFRLAEALDTPPGQLLMAAGYMSADEALLLERRVLDAIDADDRLSAAHKQTIKDLYLGLVRPR